MLPLTNTNCQLKSGIGNWKLKLATLATLAILAYSPYVLSAKALAAAEASVKEVANIAARSWGQQLVAKTAKECPPSRV